MFSLIRSIPSRKITKKDGRFSRNKENTVEPVETNKSNILEIKELPPQLKYTFLGDQKMQPTIISISLSKLEEESLMRVLRENKETLGWKVSTLKGISPTYSMHKIKLEKDLNQ